MNPLFVICVLLSALLIWIGIAFLFPAIGKVVKMWLDAFKYITKNKDEENEENEEDEL